MQQVHQFQNSSLEVHLVKWLFEVVYGLCITEHKKLLVPVLKFAGSVPK